ncbi:class I SAM-dependent methyltransferase [Sulfitobacter sp. D35]|uniref:class I SAM-dependent methyltransferase n=1 Tax=Sulfitobacter sp. D35 TaxID=3083252 RepID=UPI00296F0748|nr:class I SAM-dependent methyltransferase [Sulfitobacter sp. D35]MDW4496891.1 class I SAM-dependent methyltransferase [Sulfitobacter sp. D35]
MRRFRFDEEADVAADIRGKYGFDGELLEIFAGNTGAVVHKWHHYIPLYDRYLARFRDRPVRFLEIGVHKGGSLQMWRRYLGEQATLFGIDTDPDCATYDGAAGAVRIGSQTDTQFLSEVVAEMGGLDVVLDDGSHRMAHVRATFRHLFPLLDQGGLYMVEDLHTAYLPRFGGGHGTRTNFFAFMAELADDMHRWYHKEGLHHPGLSERVSGLHVHDSIAVIDKEPVHRPVHSRVG